jgi:hypothetical protein
MPHNPNRPAWSSRNCKKILVSVAAPIDLSPHVSLWKQWEVEEEGIVAQDVGWRDPGNAPLVGTEPGGKLRGTRVWCWLTCVGRSHQEYAYLVQRYGEANAERKCLFVPMRAGLTLMIQLVTSVRSMMASSGSAVVLASFSKAVSTPAVRDQS